MGWLLGPPNSRKAPPSPLSSRAYPDFLFAALERAACAVFCKENRKQFAASLTSTGNPGQPSDLQFNLSGAMKLSSRPELA
jgi:hypothetical protein